MSSSGRRLSNAVKKANRKERQRKKKSKPLPIYGHKISPGYGEIHRAIKNYIRHYVDSYHSKKSYNNLIPGAAIRSLYVRGPIESCDLTLDIHKVMYEQDWCSITVRYHQSKWPKISGRCQQSYDSPRPTSSALDENYHKLYTYQTPNYFKRIFSDPNFFPLLRVFLDECMLKYWGCASTMCNGTLYSAEYHANKGGIVKSCISDLEEVLVHDADDSRIVEIERSNGSFDEPSVFDIQMNGSSIGTLSALDGYVRFQNQRITIQKTVAWIADGHTYGFAKLVAEGIRHDNSSSRDTRLYPVSQRAD